MLTEPKEITVSLEWSRLVNANPVVSIEPAVEVLPVPGGMLFRVVVPGNPVVFVPNITAADLQGDS